MWLSIAQDKFESLGISLPSAIILPIWEQLNTLELRARPRCQSDCHKYLAESQNGKFSCCKSAWWMRAACTGIWVPSMAPKHCRKSHFVWKLFAIHWKSLPFCSLLIMCILKQTRKCIALLTFMHAVSVLISNLSLISLQSNHSFSYVWEASLVVLTGAGLPSLWLLAVEGMQILFQLFKDIFRDR